MDTNTLIILTVIAVVWYLLITRGPLTVLVLAVLVSLTLMSGFGVLPQWQG